MSTIRESVNDLNDMILQGAILDAFDKYYAEGVVMQDGEQPERVGFKDCRAFEEAFVGNLTAFRGAEVKSVTVDEENGTAAIEWHFDYSHAEWGDQKYDQVAYQTWKDGKVISERFYRAA
jgi:hypothetical protein